MSDDSTYHPPVSALLRPRWILGHLLAVVTVVAFVSFGFWQLRRHDEKSSLRAAVTAAQALEPVPIEQAPAGAYRRVVAVGTFDATLQTKVLRSQAGVSGYHVLTPFLLPDGSGVLVDRGWIPLEAPIPTPPTLATTIEGTLWPAETGRGGIPDSLQPAVRRIDPAIQEAFAGYDLRGEYLLLSAGADQADDVPLLPEPPEVSLGPHLGYAAQWFLFATVVVVGYPLLLRRVSAAGSTPLRR